MPAKKRLTWMLFTLAVIVGLGAVSALKTIYEDYTAIRFVRIEGDFSYLQKSEIKSTLIPLLNRGLLTTDLSLIEQKTSTIEWVNSVKAQRVWPDTLQLEVTEQVPVYRWGERYLLNQQGHSFRPRSTEPFVELPIIYADNGMPLAFYESMNHMQYALHDFGLTVTSLEVDSHQAWTLRLSTGAEIKLGRENTLKMFDRFLRSLQILGIQSIHALRRIDLRYPDGFALSLKPNAGVQWNT